MAVGKSHALLLTAAAAALFASTGIAAAGGFAVREQSAEFQGMSFAGNAAGGSLSSMFWNPAATASREGMNFESSYSILAPRVNVNVDHYNVGPGLGGNLGPIGTAYRFAPDDADGISPKALVGSTYGNYQLGNIYIGMGVNTPFGLTTEPNRPNYKGATLGETTKLVTMNFNPTIAMKVMPGVTVGAGLQAQTGEGTLRFAKGYPQSGTFVSFEGNGWAFGGTAGVTIEPMAGTTLGIGYRSRMSQELDGYIRDESIGGNSIHAKTDLKLPDIVTVSLRQVVASNMRLNATFEWSKWSEFKDLTLTATEGGKGPLNLVFPVTSGASVASLPANWSDGYMVAVGGEYDMSPTVTVRAGFAYEKSPVDSPEKRLISIPDANRYWLSTGLTWRAFANMSFDLAYSHVFIEDSRFDRNTLAPVEVPSAYTNLQGSIKSSLDIISLGLKTRF